MSDIKYLSTEASAALIMLAQRVNKDYLNWYRWRVHDTIGQASFNCNLCDYSKIHIKDMGWAASDDLYSQHMLHGIKHLKEHKLLAFL